MEIRPNKVLPAGAPEFQAAVRAGGAAEIGEDLLCGKGEGHGLLFAEAEGERPLFDKGGGKRQERQVRKHAQGKGTVSVGSQGFLLNEGPWPQPDPDSVV